MINTTLSGPTAKLEIFLCMTVMENISQILKQVKNKTKNKTKENHMPELK